MVTVQVFEFATPLAYPDVALVATSARGPAGVLLHPEAVLLTVGLGSFLSTPLVVGSSVAIGDSTGLLHVLSRDDGSLRNRFKGTPAEGRVCAKTGTLRNVWGLAGYAQGAKGEPLAFALVANNHNPPGGEVTAAMDAWVTSLVTGR